MCVGQKGCRRILENATIVASDNFVYDFSITLVARATRTHASKLYCLIKWPRLKVRCPSPSVSYRLSHTRTAILAVVTQREIMSWSETLRDNPKISCKRTDFDYRCGRRGHCLEYDHDGLAQVVVSVFATCKLITAICFFLSWFFCRRLQTKVKMEYVTTEGEGEGRFPTGVNEKNFFYNHETAMWKWRLNLRRKIYKSHDNILISFDEVYLPISL